MMENVVSTVLIGIGGYGNNYVSALLDAKQPYRATIAGVVDPHPEKCEHYARILENNIPVFSSLEQFYAKGKADLAIISSPIHFHTTQTCDALAHSSNVLCEKPLCATVQDVRKIIKARDRTGKFVAVGFNWSFTSSVQQLKQDVMNGLFGKARRFKTLVLWPRTDDYYCRNNWAGRKYSQDGKPILDSIASNATAHFLHHMFYVLGPSKDESIRLKSVTAELYRANPIETFDTCAVRVKTEDNVDLLFYATHAVEDQWGPQYVFEFERATISYTRDDKGPIIARFHDGTEKVYSNPEDDHLHKLPTCIRAVSQGNHDILCGPEAAYDHVLCINAMHESVPEIALFPTNLVKRDEERKINWVAGLKETLTQCYDDWRLPSEAGVAWSKSGETIDLTQILLR